MKMTQTTCLHCKATAQEVDGDGACLACQSAAADSAKSFLRDPQTRAKLEHAKLTGLTVHGERQATGRHITPVTSRRGDLMPDWSQRHASIRQALSGRNVGKWFWTGYYTTAYDPQMMHHERGVPGGRHDTREACEADALSYCQRVDPIASAH